LSSTVAARDSVDAWVQQGLDAGANVVVYPPAAVADGARLTSRKV
jgi:HlyD family secretion protein